MQKQTTRPSTHSSSSGFHKGGPGLLQAVPAPRLGHPTQNPCSALPEGCTHLGRASLLFMYSLYSSCVSKSQRPRGPFLLPCRERTTQSCSCSCWGGLLTQPCTPSHKAPSPTSHRSMNSLGSRSHLQEAPGKRFHGKGSRISCTPANTSGSNGSDTCLLPDTTGS